MADRISADRSFLGHPKGLAVLCFSECWERFSYAGMQALLVLYTTHYLFQPGRVETIWGFKTFRATVESVYGALTPAALASVVFGLYAGLVYLTPIVGGLLADRAIGKTRTVILGALLLTTGHALMATESGFLLALLCLVFGVGCFKTNITGQVGVLYAPGDKRRATAFQIFVLFISFAAFVAPLVCGTLGQRVGWSWGFGTAGIGMVVGLAVYLGGRKWLPPDPIAVRDPTAPKPGLALGEGKVLVVLVLLLPVLALVAVNNQQMFNAYLIWAETNYDLVAFGHAIPVTWLLSLDSITAIVSMLGVVAFWRWWGRRRTEPNEITKLTIGAAICALAPLLLAGLSIWTANGHKVSVGWSALFYAINEIGFANVYPVGLALYSRCAPKALGSSMIAIFYLHMFVANMLVGWLGGMLGRMSGAGFWLIHVALVGTAAVVLIIVRSVAGRLLTPTAASVGQRENAEFAQTEPVIPANAGIQS